jgi:tetratricopeptide (TPR) repeat protein
MRLTNTLALFGAMVALSPSIIATPAGAAGAQHARRLTGKINHEVVMADELMMKGKFAQAAEIYHDALNKDNKNIQAMNGYGMALGRQFKLDAAQEQFQKTLTEDPQNAAAHLGLAMVALNRLQSSDNSIRKNRESMLNEAESQCRQALDLDNGSPEAHYWLAQTLREKGLFSDACNSFQNAIKIDPKYSEAYSGLALVKLAQNSPAEAISNFQQAIKLNTGNSTAHFGLGKAMLQQGQVESAIKEFNTAMYQNRNSGPTHLALGDAYNQQGNYVAAIKQYQESIRIKPEISEPYLQIASIREARGDIEHSIAELRSALELMPNNSDLQQRIAEDNLRLEKLDDAIKGFEQVLTTNPSNASAAKGVTRAYYLKSQKEAAGAFFVSNEFEHSMRMMDKAIALNPNDMELRLAQAKLRAMAGVKIDLASLGTPRTDGERVAYAEALLAQNKFAEAQEQMNLVIGSAINAKQAFAVADLALMIKDLNDAEAAYKKAATMPGAEGRAQRGLDQVARARELSRQDLTLASDLARKNQLASAVDKYHSSIFADPKGASARVGLAQTLEKLPTAGSQGLREAVTQYRAYITLTPTLAPKEVEKLNKRIAKLEEKASKVEQKEKRIASTNPVQKKS